MCRWVLTPVTHVSTMSVCLHSQNWLFLWICLYYYIYLLHFRGAPTWLAPNAKLFHSWNISVIWSNLCHLCSSLAKKSPSLISILRTLFSCKSVVLLHDRKGLKLLVRCLFVIGHYVKVLHCIRQPWLMWFSLTSGSKNQLKVECQLKYSLQY